MTDIGIEVGQKMRSAVKAKLMELDCYVDDELPDYIMVMVANKRTKSQMNEDLRLFLSGKTSTFVDWLHIVLKKLKEVHVTNPNVFKNTVKRKAEDLPVDVKGIKKEKKELKQKKSSKKKESQKATLEQTKSLTDDLPLNINNKLSEARKIVLMSDSNIRNSHDYGFDIPSLSEINSSSENELRMIEKQIKNVKNRLGLIVQSDSDDDFINIKAEPNELFPNELSLNKKLTVIRQNKTARKISLTRSTSPPPPPPLPLPIPVQKDTASVHTTGTAQMNVKLKEHTRIVFDLHSSKISQKKSVLQRLGKRQSDPDEDIDFRTGLKKSTISLSEIRKEEEEILGVKRNSLRGADANKNAGGEKKTFDENRNRRESKSETDKKQNIHKRLGVMSKVAIPPQKKLEDAEESEEIVSKEVLSVVKVKPRVIPSSTQQANKNLLLKAVAEAQRSVAQTPPVGANSKPDALFTKKYHKKVNERNVKRKLPDKEKKKLKNIITHIAREEASLSNEDEDLEYVPKPVKKIIDPNKLTYVPSPKDSLLCDEQAADKQSISQNFIVTLDGAESKKFDKESPEKKPVRVSAGENNKRRTPSPIIFDMTDDKNKSSSKKSVNVPDKLPIIHAPPSIKNKERCKYWPSCRQGDKCEFLHPSSPCKLFPQCKFGDKCLYIHPTCKFESSCTRRDCPYSHVKLASRITSALAPVQATKQSLQTCKFFPHCGNLHCTFYHPRPCKFGKFCKNQSECNFSHTFIPKSNNFTWRSDFK